MAVNLPQPLFVPGGSKQRTPAEQLLISLATQIPQFGMSLLQKSMEPVDPQQEQYEASKEIAYQQNLSDPTASIKNLVAAGLGDANADPRLVGSAIEDAKVRAPQERVARVEQLEQNKIEAERLRQIELQQKSVGTFRNTILGLTRDPASADAAANLYQMRAEIPDALPAAAFNDMLGRIVGPDVAEQSSIALREVQRTEALQRITKSKSDMARESTRDAALTAFAESHGYDWYVPGLEDVMITALKDKITAADPQQLYIKIAEKFATDWKVDMMGNAVIPHTGPEAVQNALEITQQIFPEWMPVVDPIVEVEADFLATMRNGIQSRLDNREKLSTIKPIFITEGANQGIERTRLEQLWTMIIRTVPNF